MLHLCEILQDFLITARTMATIAHSTVSRDFYHHLRFGNRQKSVSQRTDLRQLILRRY